MWASPRPRELAITLLLSVPLFSGLNSSPFLSNLAPHLIPLSAHSLHATVSAESSLVCVQSSFKKYVPFSCVWVKHHKWVTAHWKVWKHSWGQRSCIHYSARVAGPKLMLPPLKLNTTVNGIAIVVYIDAWNQKGPKGMVILRSMHACLVGR